MLRPIFYAILLVLIARAIYRFWQGVREGMGRQPSAKRRVPQLGVHMVRDPVCGTFVIPSRAVALALRGEQLYFCSAVCRDAYMTRRNGRAGAPSHDGPGQERAV
jgi:YHS domain-containing protein